MYVFEIFIFVNGRLIKLLSPRRWRIKRPTPSDWNKILGLLADQMDVGVRDCERL